MNSINVGGSILVFDRPRVMGIVNLTTDSFYSASRAGGDAELVSRVAHMLEEGADIIDLGAFSSRPGASMISEEEELGRLLPAFRLLRKEFPDAVFSVDSYRSSVLSRLLDAGPFIINDITAWSQDETLPSFAERHHLPYVLMHMKGMPETMKSEATYQDLVMEILDFMARKLYLLREAGVKDVIIDPGFGFGKTIRHNFTLLRQLQAFRIFDRPLMVGLSRKSMIYHTLGKEASDALNGTTALHMAALMNGACLLRVHDVREACETIRLYQALERPVN